MIEPQITVSYKIEQKYVPLKLDGRGSLSLRCTKPWIISHHLTYQTCLKKNTQVITYDHLKLLHNQSLILKTHGYHSLRNEGTCLWATLPNSCKEAKDIDTFKRMIVNYINWLLLMCFYFVYCLYWFNVLLCGFIVLCELCFYIMYSITPFFGCQYKSTLSGLMWVTIMYSNGVIHTQYKLVILDLLMKVGQQTYMSSHVWFVWMYVKWICSTKWWPCQNILLGGPVEGQKTFS